MEVAVIVSGKIDFKTKLITKDKEAYYVMIQGSVQKKTSYLIMYVYPI